MNAPFVLVVEDNPADAEVIAETLRAIRCEVAIECAEDGQRALDILLHPRFRCDRRPNLVLLDLNLPKLGGRDVLKMIRGTRQLDHIPVLVLTSSADEKEIAELYRLGANAYLVKPMLHGDFVRLLRVLAEFWLSTTALPA